MLPIFLRTAGRLSLVVGGGPVGRRKAATLVAAGLSVRLVSPSPRPADLAEPAVEWLAEPYHASHLAGVSLAVAAATPAVDAALLADARARGVWACLAGDPEGGDFVLPAVVRRGEFVLAVSTGGASPALARQVRERLEADFDETFGAWVALLADFRRWVLEHVTDPARRRLLLESAADPAWLARLRRDGPEATRAALWASAGR